MENLNLENISSSILQQFEQMGISKDNLLILSIILFLIIEKSDDYILIIILILLIK